MNSSVKFTNASSPSGQQHLLHHVTDAGGVHQSACRILISAPALVLLCGRG